MFDKKSLIVYISYWKQNLKSLDLIFDHRLIGAILPNAYRDKNIILGTRILPVLLKQNHKIYAIQTVQVKILT